MTQQDCEGLQAQDGGPVLALQGRGDQPVLLGELELLLPGSTAWFYCLLLLPASTPAALLWLKLLLFLSSCHSSVLPQSWMSSRWC